MLFSCNINPNVNVSNAAYGPDSDFVAAEITKSELQPADTDRYASSASIALPHYTQEQGMSCGPACCKMINYYFGQPVSESTICSYCGGCTYGTSISSLCSWLNSSPRTGYLVLPAWWVWEVVHPTSRSDLENKVGWSIDTYDAPQIWLVGTYFTSYYHMSGWTWDCSHFVAIRGYNSSGIYYNDPWTGAGGGSNKYVSWAVGYYCMANEQGGWILY